MTATITINYSDDTEDEIQQSGSVADIIAAATHMLSLSEVTSIVVTIVP